MDFLVLVIARLFGPITSTIVFVCDIDLKFSSVFFEAYQTLGCHWLLDLLLMALVAWQWKGCNSRWKKVPMRCLNNRDDWVHFGPQMSEKLQGWWEDDNREPSIRLSPDGMSFFKFAMQDKVTQGALLVSGGKAPCSIMVKPINSCILLIEDVAKVEHEFVKVTFQMGMSGATWFSQTSHISMNWRVFLTTCTSKLDGRLTKPEIKFVRLLRMDGSIVDITKHPIDEVQEADHAYKRPASKRKSMQTPAAESAKKLIKVKENDMPLTAAERNKFVEKS